MQIIKATASLFLPGLAAAATRTHNGIRPLAGATPTRATELDARDVLAGDEQEATAGYTYSLSVNASLPVDDRIDRCVAWPAGEANFDRAGVSNGVNFTWYGLRIMLPDDGAAPSGFRYPDLSGATRELGWTQDYGDAAEVLAYNVTTQESQPTVKINFNDELFWNTFKFDFVQSGGGAAAVSDGADYQEFKKELRGAIYCWTVIEENYRQSIFPVVPTLTISMRRLDGPSSPPGPAPSSTAAAVVTRGRSLSLGVFAAAVTWVSAAYV